MGDSLRPGWAWPEHAQKAHYFPVDTATSLCGDYVYAGIRTAIRDGSFDVRFYCNRCMRRYKRSIGNKGVPQYGEREY